MDASRGKGGGPPAQDAVAHPEPASKQSRKPYQKPAFRWERMFETMALACGKISPTQGHCRFNRKSS
jgi:hypothetical protein